MANPYYFLTEREVYGLLNALSSTSPQNAEDTYSGASLALMNAGAYQGIINPAFPPSLVHQAILDVETILIRAIANTEGHPRRVDYLSVKTLSHMDPLPSTLAAFGSVYDPLTMKYLSPSTPDQVRDLRDSAVVTADGNPLVCYYWAADGSRFYVTLSTAASCEMYIMPAAPTSFSAVAALFSSSSPQSMRVAEEFRAAVAFGAAGVCASKCGSFPTEASGYLQMFTQLAQELGVTAKMAIDYVPSGGQVNA